MSLPLNHLSQTHLQPMMQDIYCFLRINCLHMSSRLRKPLNLCCFPERSSNFSNLISCPLFNAFFCFWLKLYFPDCFFFFACSKIFSGMFQSSSYVQAPFTTRKWLKSCLRISVIENGSMNWLMVGTITPIAGNFIK